MPRPLKQQRNDHMINGIINVYKEPGFTSHDVVAKLRGITKQKKIGHTGTLDPDAAGVLPVCLGRATKAAGLLTDERKTYQCVLLLGKVTDTQDAGGNLLRECTTEGISESRAREVILSFLGPRMQIPPMYSARKINGKRLYELAREGRTVEREARPVVFYRIDILETALPRVTFSVTCSRGTYIRTLCNDIGEALGCGGCMEHLVRTQVGPFSLNDARKLAEIEQLAADGTLDLCVQPVDQLFEDLKALRALPEGDRLLHNGNPVVPELLEEASRLMLKQEETPPESAGRYRMYDSTGVFVGLFSRKGSCLRPGTMFYEKPEDQA